VRLLSCCSIYFLCPSLNKPWRGEMEAVGTI